MVLVWLYFTHVSEWSSVCIKTLVFKIPILRVRWGEPDQFEEKIFISSNFFQGRADAKKPYYEKYQ